MESLALSFAAMGLSGISIIFSWLGHYTQASYYALGAIACACGAIALAVWG
jgi:hypothetical protein